jgi:hypothetical protein
VTRNFPAAVTVTRSRHPVEGRELAVLGRMLRHGQPELLLVFPDGAKRLVPESWTDAVPQEGNEPGTLGAAADLLALSVLISALPASSQPDREQAARKPPAREDDRAACSAQSAARRGSGATAGADQPATGGKSHRGHHAAGRPDRQDAGRRGGGGRR